jgi:hypothetical protein
MVGQRWELGTMEREKVLNVSSESLASHLGEALACSTYPCLALFFQAKYNTRDKKYAGRKEFCLTIYPIRAEECRNRQFPPSRRGLALAEILSPTTTTTTLSPASSSSCFVVVRPLPLLPCPCDDKVMLTFILRVTGSSARGPALRLLSFLPVAISPSTPTRPVTSPHVIKSL